MKDECGDVGLSEIFGIMVVLFCGIFELWELRRKCIDRVVIMGLY